MEAFTLNATNAYRRAKLGHSRYEEPPEETIWSDDVLIPLDSGTEFALPISHRSPGFRDANVLKRGANQAFGDFETSSGGLFNDNSQQWFAQTFPDFVPSVPLLQERKLDNAISNPFTVDGIVAHPRLRSRPITAALKEDGAVNGLVKFRFQLKQEKSSPSSQRWDAYNKQPDERPHDPFHMSLPNLPKDFGRNLRLDMTDSKLLKFYTIAFCSGRTLLPESNGFLNDITPMAAESPCVKHALLALASTYVLDYLPSKKLEQRANMHHKRAVMLLTQELNNQETYTPGKEDPVIGALVLLCHDDLVNWEIDRARSITPKWLTGNRTAKFVLDKSDPGYRYNRPINVQSSKARRYLGNKVALADIFCSVAAPLVPDESKCPYPWLLEGSEREVRRIDGLNGLCPKLLHIFAQITHLAAKVAMDPRSMVAPMAGRVLETRLQSFHQWSEASEGYPTPELLIDACILSEDGKVVDPVKMTEIIAESYTASAQLYLQCRLFRKPRSHPTVQRISNILLQLISRMPTEGPLYTAQSPLFSVFIAGTVATTPTDRDILRTWFYHTCVGSRGNVPPAWRAMQMVWQWQDTVLTQEEFMDAANGSIDLPDEAIAERRPWWEEMVLEIEQSEGRMNLA